MSLCPSRVAARFEVRLAVREVLGEGRRASSVGIPEEALIHFGEALWLSPGARRASFAGLTKKLRQLAGVFSKAPRLWEDFKRLFGIESLAALPALLQKLAKQGSRTLKGVLNKIFSQFPLNIFLIRGAGVNDFLRALVRRVPTLERALARVKEQADFLGDLLKRKAPVLSTVLIVAVFFFIWMNVLEFEWNLADLSRALIGQISLGDLLASLPGSALGFLLNSLGISTFGLLPAAIAARILWLLSQGFIQWDGSWFQLNEEALRRAGYEVVSFV